MEKRDTETQRGGGEEKERVEIEDKIQASLPRYIRTSSPYPGSETYSCPFPIYFGVAGAVAASWGLSNNKQ